MPDARHKDQTAIGQRSRHRSQIRRNDPAVHLAPEDKMGMLQLWHPPLQFSAVALTDEIDGRADPDAFGNAKGLLNNAVEQRLHLPQTLAESRSRVWRKT